MLIKDICAEYRVPRSTIIGRQGWIQQGLPMMKVGGKWQGQRTAVVAWIRGHKPDSAASGPQTAKAAVAEVEAVTESASAPTWRHDDPASVLRVFKSMNAYRQYTAAGEIQLAEDRLNQIYMEEKFVPVFDTLMTFWLDGIDRIIKHFVRTYAITRTPKQESADAEVVERIHDGELAKLEVWLENMGWKLNPRSE